MVERRETGRRRPGTTGVVVIVALAAIAGAWLMAAFSGTIASATQATQERVTLVFMSEEEKIREGAREYVVATLGYSGSDVEEYRSGIKEVANYNALLSSPEGQTIRAYEDEVEDGGIKAAASLEHFEIERIGDGEARGVARYDFGDSYGPGGQVRGNVATFEQELTLSKQGQKWQVREGGTPSEIGE